VNTRVKLNISNLKKEEMGYLKKSLKILKGQSMNLSTALSLSFEIRFLFETKLRKSKTDIDKLYSVVVTITNF
jgi:hypothetical protein